MRNSALLLIAVLSVSASAQISRLPHDLPEIRQIQTVLGSLKGFLLFGYSDGLVRYGSPLSRKEYAAVTLQLVEMLEMKLQSDRPIQMLEGDAWKSEFWKLRWLGRTLADEISTVESQPRYEFPAYEKRIEWIKEKSAKKGVVVDDPYARFSDVPKGHWADEAIHILREVGIIRGFPDNTFRG